MECNAAIGLSGNILYLNVIMLFSLKLSLMDLGIGYQFENALECRKIKNGIAGELLVTNLYRVPQICNYNNTRLQTLWRGNEYPFIQHLFTLLCVKVSS